jgi:hypothetical protein
MEAGYRTRQIDDDALYMVYKFLTMVVLNKEEATIISKTELYILWCIREGKRVQVYPLIIETMKNIVTKKGRVLPRLTYGALITAICYYHGQRESANDNEVETVFADICLRKKGDTRAPIYVDTDSDEEMDVDVGPGGGQEQARNDDDDDDEDYAYETDEEAEAAHRMTMMEERMMKRWEEMENRAQTRHQESLNTMRALDEQIRAIQERLGMPRGGDVGPSNQG